MLTDFRLCDGSHLVRIEEGRAGWICRMAARNLCRFAGLNADVYWNLHLAANIEFITKMTSAEVDSQMEYSMRIPYPRDSVSVGRKSEWTETSRAPESR